MQLPQIHADVAARDAQPLAQIIGRPIRSRDVEQGEQLAHRGVDPPGSSHQAPVRDEFSDQMFRMRAMAQALHGRACPADPPCRSSNRSPSVLGGRACMSSDSDRRKRIHTMNPLSNRIISEKIMKVHAGFRVQYDACPDPPSSTERGLVPDRLDSWSGSLPELRRCFHA